MPLSCSRLLFSIIFSENDRKFICTSPVHHVTDLRSAISTSLGDQVLVLLLCRRCWPVRGVNSHRFRASVPISHSKNLTLLVSVSRSFYFEHICRYQNDAHSISGTFSLYTVRNRVSSTQLNIPFFPLHFVSRKMLYRWISSLLLPPRKYVLFPVIVLHFELNLFPQQQHYISGTQHHMQGQKDQYLGRGEDKRHII